MLGNINYSAHITEATLLVRRVKVNSTVLVAHSKTLAGTTAKYSITRVEVKSFTIHSGVNGQCLENVILGQLPKRVVLGFVDNKAFNGDRKLNPFNFQNYSINFLSLYVDGAQIPSKPLQPLITGNSPQLLRHITLFSLALVYSTQMKEIRLAAMSRYANGYCLFAFDLTPDLSAQFAGHWNLVKNGTMRIEVQFEKTLTKTINCILYAEFDNVLEIDAARQIIVDFNS